MKNLKLRSEIGRLGDLKLSYKCLISLCIISPLIMMQTALAKPATGITQAAQTLHQQLLVIDSHLDTALHLARPDWDILTPHHYADDFSQVDWPRMQQGGLKAGFWAIYTPQGTRTPQANAESTTQALATAVRIQDLARQYPQQFALAKTADELRANAVQGRHSIILSIENATPLASSPTKMLGVFERLGVRMLGLVHSKNNDFADSSTDQPEWQGLSPAGQQLVKAAACHGMIIDVSHASDQVLDQVLQISNAPVIASHSSSKAIYDHPRNLDDQRIRQLATKGGVIQVTTYPAYMGQLDSNPVRQAAQSQLFAGFKQPALLTQTTINQLAARQQQLEHDYPLQHAPNLERFMQHLLHVLKLVGAEHVGIGADWDGGGGVKGLEDVSALPQITARLLAAGYSAQEIKNIWGENLLRLLQQAEQLKRSCQ